VAGQGADERELGGSRVTEDMPDTLRRQELEQHVHAGLDFTHGHMIPFACSPRYGHATDRRHVVIIEASSAPAGSTHDDLLAVPFFEGPSGPEPGPGAAEAARVIGADL